MIRQTLIATIESTAAALALKDPAGRPEIEYDCAACGARAVKEEDSGHWPLLVIMHTDACPMFRERKTDGT